jgi:hypothetical protein
LNSVNYFGDDINFNFVNATDKNSSKLGVNPLKTGKIVKEISKSAIGQYIVDRANAGDIDLALSIPNDVPSGLMGISRGNYGSAYVRNTQSYKETALTLIHEGIHALGVGGSRRAEAIARLAEVQHQGGTLDRATMRQVLQDIRSAQIYDNLPWRLNAQSTYFRSNITF